MSDIRILERVVTAAVALALCAQAAVAQSVDDIVNRHVQARGGLERLKAVRSIRMTGVMTVAPGKEAPVTLELKRPFRMRRDFVFQGMTATQAYDGSTGWSIMPFGGRTDADEMSPDELEAAREQADFEGPLVDYRAKGHAIESLGKELVGETDAHRLKVTLAGGAVRYFYLDAQRFLVVKIEGRSVMMGQQVDSVTTLGGYKRVEGVVFPSLVETVFHGTQVKQRLAVEAIEVNVPIEDARFVMPARKPEA